MKKTSTELMVGLFMVIGFINFAIIAVMFGSGSLLRQKGYEVKAHFTVISGLKKTSMVEIAGVPVGEVKSIEKVGDKALVVMNIYSGVDIADDSFVSIRTKGIIGEKYLKITPGSSKNKLKDGDELADTESVVDIEDMIGSIAYKFGGGEIKRIKGYELFAKFDSVIGLKEGAAIRIAGVQAGLVKSITLEGSKAKITMTIQEGLQIEDDVLASVRTNGLIGEKYIKITPGASEDMLEDGDEITETESVVDIEELIGKFIYGNK